MTIDCGSGFTSSWCPLCLCTSFFVAPCLLGVLHAASVLQFGNTLSIAVQGTSNLLDILQRMTDTAFILELHDPCFICSRSSARESGNPVSLTWIPVQSFHVVTCLGNYCGLYSLLLT